MSLNSTCGIVIAYEPVWAIGTGKNATTKDAKDAIALIREFIHSRYGSETAAKVRILYGGSVKPENVSTYMEQEGIDGALVGGASLRPILCKIDQVLIRSGAMGAV